MATPILERECGECAVCCKVAEIPGFLVAGAECPYHSVSTEGSCKAFGAEERHPVCESFACMWLRGLGKSKDRPDNIGALFTINSTAPGKVIGFVGEQEAGALLGPAMDMAVAFAREMPMPLIVVPYGDDSSGKYVILRDDLVKKASAMIGAELTRLSYDVAMYERVIL